MEVQMELFDKLPTVMPENSAPAVVYGHKANQKNGHLLIASGGLDWLFLNTGGGVIRCCLPGWDTGVDLNPEQLRVLGRYCLDIADRIENR
jgi:hypothetical protein